MRVLVTGAAGFIGSHVLKSLLDSQEDVIGLDNFSSYYSVEFKRLRLIGLGINEANAIIHCDISDFSQVHSVIQDVQPNYIIHLAAQAGVRLSMENSDRYISDNITGFHNIIRSAIDNKVEGIIYASSSSIYGDIAPTPYTEKSLIFRPKSLYGVSKLVNELNAEIYSKSSLLRFRGLRFFTVYGPWGRPDMAYFRLAAASLEKQPFTLFGDGSVKRDFTYIDDVVKSTLLLLSDLTHRERGFNDVVNIGGWRPMDINYLIKLIESNGEHQIEMLREEASSLDSKITVADNSYLQSIVGQLNFTKLEVGVERLMNWARQGEIRSELPNWIRSTV
jgi:UDP-glucuronate 4-epimerase